MSYISIFSNPVYINIAILCLLVFLVLFLWRKIMVLEGNFFILEKRVNLIKKESRENALNKKLENSNTIMNEIFQDMVTPEAIENIGQCSFNSCGIPPSSSVEILEESNATNITDVKDINEVNEIENVLPEVVFNTIAENTEISFDMDKKDADALSTTSEIVFNNDKYTNKKLSKLNLDKLKEICVLENLSFEGNKAQIINRILEVNKNITIE